MSAVRRPVRGTDGVAVGAVVVAGASVPYPSTFPTLVSRLAAEYRAACRQFDVDHGEQAESGPKQVCRTCPVLQQGRCHALAVREPYRDMGLGYRSDQGISTQDLGQQRGPTRKPTRNPLRRSDRTPKKHKISPTASTTTPAGTVVVALEPALDAGIPRFHASSPHLSEHLRLSTMVSVRAVTGARPELAAPSGHHSVLHKWRLPLPRLR
jgi:hypothetical protein